MRIYSIDITDQPQKIVDLIQDPQMRHTNQISLQAPKNNLGVILFGNQKLQPIELRPKSNANLAIVTFNSIYVKGLNGDKLTVVLLDA